MRVIHAHRTLFFKAALSGLLIIIASVVLFISLGSAMLDSPGDFWKKEAREYFSRLEHESGHYMERRAQQAASALSEILGADNNIAGALAECRSRLKHSEGNDFHVWLIDNSNRPASFASPDETLSLPVIPENADKRMRKFFPATIDGHGYLLVAVPFDFRGRGEWTLVTAAERNSVYRSLDWDNRIIGYEPGEQYEGKTSNEISANAEISIPVRARDGSQAGRIRIRTIYQTFADKYLWGWQVTMLSLLPVLCVIIFIYLVYRYFASFSAHSIALGRLLRSDRPGVEIFRRDKQVVEKYMPELAELFGLAGESAAEKSYFKKSCEQFGMILEVVGDRGFDNKTLSDILEFLLKGMPDCGGAIFANPQAAEPSVSLGRYNVGDEIIDLLEKSPRGQGFLKFAARHPFKQGINDISEFTPENDIAEIFSGYGGAYIVPLVVRGKSIALMLLISFGSDQGKSFISCLSDQLIELIAVLACGVLLEKDKHHRADGSRILQETSLAISSTLDLSSVLRIVAHRLTDYTSATYCMILLNTGGDAVEVASFFSKRREGVKAPAVDKLNLAEYPGLSGTIMANQATVLNRQDIEDLSLEERAFFNGESIESLTVLPIAHSAKFIGSIILGEERSRARGSVGGDRLTIIQAIASQAASAIENARLYGFIKQQVDQLTASHNVSAIINSEIEIDRMLNRVLDATAEYLEFDYSIIYGVSPNKTNLRPLACRGLSSDPGKDGTVSINSNSIPGLVVSTGEAVVIDDTRLDSSLKSSFPAALSELAVPIKIAENVAGVFCVGNKNRNSFRNTDEEFLQSLASQIAVAMDKAELFEKEKERSKRLKIIYEFSRQMSKTLNLSEVLELAADSVRDTFGCHLVFIMLRDNSSGEFYLARESSLSTIRIIRDDLKVTEDNLLGRTVNAARTLYCADTVDDTAYFPGVKGLRSLVSVPVTSGSKAIAILGLGSVSPDDFSTEDINTVEAIGDILAVALEKSFLFRETTEKAERLSLIDKINTAISTALDLDSFFNVVAKAVTDNAGYRWTLLVVPDGNSFACKAGYSPQALGEIYPAPVLELLKIRFRSVFETGAPEFVSFSELASMGRPDTLQPIIDAGIRHLALLPIGASEKCEAVLAVGSTRKDGFSVQELSLLHDITVHLQIAWQNARLYEQLKTAYRQLQEAQDHVIQTEKLRALGEMSSGVVHDFNNILAAILGRVQLMLKRMESIDNKEWQGFYEKNLSVIETAVKDGSSILSRISEFTKKRPTEKFINLDIGEILSDVIELTKPRWQYQAKAEGKTIELDYRCEGGLVLFGNASELREVFTNLIINAVDAIEGEGKIGIFATVRDETKLQVVVEDSGHGMTEDTRKRIFEPFFTTKGKSGTGLGLSVTYGIINRHGGNIDVESQVGAGTRFRITLPRCTSAPSIDGEHDSPITDFVKASILVVDDDESLRSVLSEILESIGHEVEIASGGEEALEKLAGKAYDLVITDLGMNDISGWELADLVHSKSPSTKIVLATGWGAQIEPGSLKLHHVDGIVGKPFKISDIAGIVGDVIKNSPDEVSIEEV